MAAVPARSIRAVSEYMSVLPEGPDLYTVVSQSGKEYVVDLRDGAACTCPDFRYGGGVEACKHVLRARIETGRSDVEQFREALALAAVAAEEAADRFERQSGELRQRARRIRLAAERLDSLVEND